MGYLSIAPTRGKGIFNQEMLDALTTLKEGKWFKVVEFDSDLFVYVDGKSRKAVVKL